MLIYMLKDVENVGMAGSLVKVSDGYATNFLIPQKCAVKVDKNQEAFYRNKAQKEVVAKEIISSKIQMLAERIKNLNLSLKKRVHDNGKLYGAVSSDEIVDLLKDKDFSVTKKQIVFAKSIKTVGEHKVGVKLSSKVTPEFTLKVVADSAA